MVLLTQVRILSGIWSYVLLQNWCLIIYFTWFYVNTCSSLHTKNYLKNLMYTTEACLGRCSRIHWCEPNTTGPIKHCLCIRLYPLRTHTCVQTGHPGQRKCTRKGPSAFLFIHAKFNPSLSYTLTKNRRVLCLFDGKQKEPIWVMVSFLVLIHCLISLQVVSVGSLITSSTVFQDLATKGNIL